jgi:hypothetical protein
LNIKSPFLDFDHGLASDGARCQLVLGLADVGGVAGVVPTGEAESKPPMTGNGKFMPLINLW